MGQLGRSNNDSNKNRKETGLDWQNNGFTHASRLFCTFISLPSLHNNDVKLPYFTFCGQCAKKVVSHSLGLVDFAIGLVCSVFKLPDGQLKFFGEIKSQRTESNLLIMLQVVEMTFGLLHASFSLPKWQAVKLPFFSPWWRK